ncbi:hypothetical protein ABB07_16535 [Streptomyces incarnatus]|uniref:Uncharacterized protein n=1 Tax=Streptomyces incarnatus TaxID=665007 RepID=A0ABM5TKY8_9ACTN|nr:hypothetical protein [Streptomyces incarnatus]AKJ11581.1 hypothetical protein ABB07_16535 [Streptomyces incarnatus]
MINVAPAIAEAVEAVRAHFAGHSVVVETDGAGGVIVTIDEVIIGPAYTSQSTWLGFQISAAYPDADIYPHYCGVLSRTDGQAHGPAIQHVQWRDRPALQISRRSNHRDPRVDSAALKAERIRRWLADQ